jgi:hypothetical protein
MPTLISISPDGASRFVGVDDEGAVWRGELKSDPSDGEVHQLEARPIGVPRSLRCSEAKPLANMTQSSAARRRSGRRGARCRGGVEDAHEGAGPMTRSAARR